MAGNGKVLAARIALAAVLKAKAEEKIKPL